MKIKINTKLKTTTFVAVGIFFLGLSLLAAGTFLDPRLARKRRISRVAVPSSTRNLDKRPEQLQLGCYVQIDNDSILVTGGIVNELQASSMCKNLFLANYYLSKGEREGFFYLLKNETTSSIDLPKLNQADKVSVFYQSATSKEDFFDFINKKAVSDQCEEIGFWGVPLRCFNEITGANYKVNHLPHILRYLTFLRYTSSYQDPQAYQSLVEHGVVIEDDSLNICKEGGADLTPGDPMIMYLFKKNFEGDLNAKKIVHTAGVIYHESLHLISLGHYYRKIDGVCVVKGEIPELKQKPVVDEKGCNLSSGVLGFDADWSLSMHKSPEEGGGASVYGGQNYYLSFLFKSSEFSCEYRKAAFDDYNFNREKLCNSAPEFKFIDCQ